MGEWLEKLKEQAVKECNKSMKLYSKKYKRNFLDKVFMYSPNEKLEKSEEQVFKLGVVHGIFQYQVYMKKEMKKKLKQQLKKLGEEGK